MLLCVTFASCAEFSISFGLAEPYYSNVILSFGSWAFEILSTRNQLNCLEHTPPIKQLNIAARLSMGDFLCVKSVHNLSGYRSCCFRFFLAYFIV